MAPRPATRICVAAAAIAENTIMQAPAVQTQPAHRPARSLSKYVLFAILSVFALFGLASLVFLSFSAGRLFNRQPRSTFTAGPATIDQVRSLKLLTVLSFEITTDMEAEHAERKGVWLARGSADYVVDFSKAVVLGSDESSRTVRIRLPSPVVRNAHLDATRTKLLTIEKTGLGWWTLGAVGSRDDFEQQSRVMLQRRVELAAKEAALLESARGSAVQLMSGLYGAVDWKVRIEWDETSERR